MAMILTYRLLSKNKPQHNRLLKNRAMILDAEEFFQYKKRMIGKQRLLRGIADSNGLRLKSRDLMAANYRLPKDFPIVNEVTDKQCTHALPQGGSRAKAPTGLLKLNAGKFLDLVDEKREHRQQSEVRR